MKLSMRLLIGLLLVAGFASSGVAGTYHDPIFGFEVTTPDNWIVQGESEGDDRVLKMQSPDGNAYGEARAVRLGAGVTVAMLRDTFAHLVLPEAVLLGAQKDAVGGLTGEVAAWRLSKDGQSLAVGGFFAVQGQVGYILMTTTAEADFNTYATVYDQIFASFVPGHVSQTDQSPKIATPPLPQIDRTGTAMHAGLVPEAHPELGFVIVHHDTWEADQPEHYSVRLGPSELPPAQRPSIVVEALAGNAYASHEDGAADLKRQLSDMPAIHFDQEGPHIIETLVEDGQPLPGWSFGATYLVNGVPFRQLTFLFKRAQPSVWYAVYVTGPTAEVVARQPEMMRILQTLQMIPFSN